MLEQIDKELNNTKIQWACAHPKDKMYWLQQINKLLDMRLIAMEIRDEQEKFETTKAA